MNPKDMAQQMTQTAQQTVGPALDLQTSHDLKQLAGYENLDELMFAEVDSEVIPAQFNQLNSNLAQSQQYAQNEMAFNPMAALYQTNQAQVDPSQSSQYIEQAIQNNAIAAQKVDQLLQEQLRQSQTL